MITALPAHLMPMVEKAAAFQYERVRESHWPVWAGADPDIKSYFVAELEGVFVAFLNACLDGGVAKLDPAWEHPALCTSIILNIGEG